MNNKTYPIYFAFGALALYLVFVVVPGIGGILYSFTDWTNYSDKISFIGLDNFKTIFSNSSGTDLVAPILNTIKFTIGSTFFKTLIAFCLALLLVEGVKGKNIHRTIIFIPAILSTLVISILFKFVLNPDYGILNAFLRTFGLGALQKQWLVDSNTALYSVMAVDVWKGIGYIMTILFAGLMSIPYHYYEAAHIDGANYWQKTRFVTIPLMMPSITITTVLNVLYGLKVFDIIIVLTNGGPGNSTSVINQKVYEHMAYGYFGLGTAMSSLLFVTCVICGYFIIRVLNRDEVGL